MMTARDDTPQILIDIVDETFVRASPREVRSTFDRLRPDALWPNLTPEVMTDRGPLGVRWHIEGEVVGRMEVWLEGLDQGTIVHHFVQGHLSPPPAWSRVIGRVWPRWAAQRAAADYRRRHARHWKSAIHTLKDHVEGRER